MAIIFDGKNQANLLTARLTKRVLMLSKKGIKPGLAVILVGDDQASKVYVHKKEQAAGSAGIFFKLFHYPASARPEFLVGEIKKIVKDKKFSGVIIQWPLPKKLWLVARDLADLITPEKDVDCLSRKSLAGIMMGEKMFIPPTPSAIFEVLNSAKISLAGKEVCLIGRGELIGKPLAAMLLNLPITLTVCGRSTKNLSDYTKTADIIITAVGKSNLLTGAMIKSGAVVIDAGSSFIDGSQKGDIDFNSIVKKASLVTHTPGGVGPLTVAKLLENTVLASELQGKK